jgi:hypothetical protein
MATTKRTVKEAVDYISESISYWEKDEEKKIMSLASMAEKWRRSKTISPVKKMKEVQKNIKALTLIIKRNLKMNPNSDNTVFEKSINIAQSEYDKLLAEQGEPKTKEKLYKEASNKGITDLLP